jgi:hypothetical protein
MKTTALMTAAAIALLGLGARAQMDDQTKTKITKERASSLDPSQMRTLTIKVKDVDRAQHKVLFEAQVSPEATASKDGQTIRVDQLKPGDEVRASFDPSTGEVLKLEVTKIGSGSSPSDSNSPNSPSSPSSPDKKPY